MDAHHGVILPHSAQGPVCTLAGLQIAASAPNHHMQEYFDQFNVGWEKDLLTSYPKFDKGHLEIPMAPGLGADLNLEVVKAHPYREHGHMEMWDEGWHLRTGREPGK